MDNVCISIFICFTASVFKNVAKVLDFRAQNNLIPAHKFFDKKVKGIVYSDKNTGFFFPPELKSRSPDPLQPHRPNAVYLDLSTELSTHPALPKIWTIKNLF